MTTEQLIAEKELLSDPSRWTKGHLARGANGSPISHFSKDAVCWCQLGAAQKIRFTFDLELRPAAISSQFIRNDIARLFGFSCAIGFNDHPDTTHEMLMKFYDECIKESKKVL